jgi:hypothetical protein
MNGVLFRSSLLNVTHSELVAMGVPVKKYGVFKNKVLPVNTYEPKGVTVIVKSS